MGVCVIVFAVAMAAQAAAGFQLLRIIKPLLNKKRQLINESKHLIEISENLVHEARPRLSTTVDKARGLAKRTSVQISEVRKGTEEIVEPLTRFHNSFRARPKRIRTSAPTVSGLPQHKIGEEQ